MPRDEESVSLDDNAGIKFSDLTYTRTLMNNARALYGDVYNESRRNSRACALDFDNGNYVNSLFPNRCRVMIYFNGLLRNSSDLIARTNTIIHI